MTAGLYDDDEFRKFWKHTEAAKNIQKMIDDVMAPTLQMIKQSEAVSAAQKQVADSIRPALDALTLQTMRDVATSMPAIQVPALPSFSFSNITQLKLGDAVAQQFATSADFDEIVKNLGRTTHQIPSTPTIDPNTITETELDELVDAVFADHPDLLEQLEKDHDLTTLDDYQKKVMCWLLGLMVALGVGVLYSWAQTDENVANTIEIVEKVGGASYATYRAAEKFLWKNEEKKDDNQEGTGLDQDSPGQ